MASQMKPRQQGEDEYVTPVSNTIFCEARRRLLEIYNERDEETGVAATRRAMAAAADVEGEGRIIPVVNSRFIKIYQGVGKFLSRYRAGKLPKAFKIIPSLSNWEYVLFLTEPEKWSLNAVYQATRVFASNNLNARMAQRFYNLVLLPRIRNDIREHKILHFVLYQAMKKAVYKPSAFYQGLLLPLCQTRTCNFSEAVIIGRILQRVSIPVQHSSVALLEIAEMEYSDTNSYFLKLLLDKEYALPYRVLDSVLAHFVGFIEDDRDLPVIWHLSLLTFVQRNLRGFLRWMRDNNVEYSAGLSFHIGDSVADIGVKARVDLHEGEMIATIPKQACLTIITSEAETVISEAELGGGLGLVVALMYERSLGELSKWDGYLRLVPFQQCLPIVWSLPDIDRLLTGTELHKVVKEDRRLMKSDWKECYGILIDLFGESKFPAKWFSFEHYLAAKTLVASRAFQVDDVHGYGMVPLADLFNHKTGAEDVHFTSVFSDSDSDSEEPEPSTPDSADETLEEATKRGRKVTSSVDDRNNLKEATKELGKSNNGMNRSPKPKEATEKKGKPNIGVVDSPKPKRRGKSNPTVDESPEISKEAIMKRDEFASNESPKPKEVAYKRNGKPNSIKEEAEPAKEGDPGAEEDDAVGLPSNWEESSEVLEMIMVKDVAKGTEIYNTYGLLSNAALLHRYGFTEPDNPFDIVNVDLAIVIHVCGRLSSKRHVRRCLTLWRQAGCAPCSSQGTEYFEFSVDGKPQSELLLLLYLIHVPDATRDNVEQQARHWNADEVELSDDEEIERVSSAAVDKLAKALGWTMKLKNSSSRKRSRDGFANGTPNGSNTRRMTPQRTSVLPRKEDSSCLTDFDKWLLKKSVCSSLLTIVAERDSIYPEVRSMTSEKLGSGSLSSTLQDDRELLKTRDRDIDPMLYHALSLRIGERTILDKCATLMKIKSKK